MLRRAPTQIQLTADDIAQYEENRLHRLAQQAAAARQNSYQNSDMNGLEAAQRAGRIDPNDELKPHPSDKARQVRYGSLSAQAGNIGASGQPGAQRTLTREERLGIGR